MIIRAQLFGPDNHIVPDSQYNELFTMHGTIMLLLFARGRRVQVPPITRFDGVRCGLGMCDVGTPPDLGGASRGGGTVDGSLYGRLGGSSSPASTPRSTPRHGTGPPTRRSRWPTCAEPTHRRCCSGQSPNTGRNSPLVGPGAVGCSSKSRPQQPRANDERHDYSRSAAGVPCVAS